MNKKFTLTVAIPAYNEESNIKSLLLSLLAQKTYHFNLLRIVVLSDQSDDLTDEIVLIIRKISKKVHLQTGSRVGKSRKISKFARECTSDVLLFLDADITIKSDTFLEEIVKPFQKNENIGLVGACDLPKKGQGYIEQSINESICAWNEFKERLNRGDSIHNIHGCAYAISKKLYKKFHVPSRVFNDDEFAYLLNKKLGYDFIHTCDAAVYYQAPKNITDFVLQSSRFNVSRSQVVAHFGVNSEREFMIPEMLKYKIFFKHLILHQAYFIGAVVLQLIFKLKKKSYKENLKRGYWDRIESTKLSSAPSFSIYS